MKYIWPILLLSACVEIFEFDTSSEDRAVILEGVFTDVSALDYFSKYDELRYFDVKLKWASPVRNVRDEPIVGAEIELSADGTEFWDYTEVEPGVYQLLYPDLKAQPGVEYQLRVDLPEGGTIVSNLEQLPEESQEGEVYLEEKKEFQYVNSSGENVIKLVNGVEVRVDVPASSNDNQAYYRWDFQTTWVLSASFVLGSDVGRCWITEQYLYDDYILAEVRDLDVTKDLFFVTIDKTNPKTEHGFAVRIRQLGMTSDNYRFWTDLQKQGEQADLFAPPPYNLSSNLSISEENLDIYGYFGVSHEVNYLWFLDLRDIGQIPAFEDPCFPVVPGPEIPVWCSNCLRYDALKHRDQITNIRPRWWNP